MTVIIPPERKLAKRISVHWLGIINVLLSQIGSEVYTNNTAFNVINSYLKEKNKYIVIKTKFKSGKNFQYVLASY